MHTARGVRAAAAAAAAAGGGVTSRAGSSHPRALTKSPANAAAATPVPTTPSRASSMAPRPAGPARQALQAGPLCHRAGAGMRGVVTPGSDAGLGRMGVVGPATASQHRAVWPAGGEPGLAGAGRPGWSLRHGARGPARPGVWILFLPLKPCPTTLPCRQEEVSAVGPAQAAAALALSALALAPAPARTKQCTWESNKRPWQPSTTILDRWIGVISLSLSTWRTAIHCLTATTLSNIHLRSWRSYHIRLHVHCVRRCAPHTCTHVAGEKRRVD